MSFYIEPLGTNSRGYFRSSVPETVSAHALITVAVTGKAEVFTWTGSGREWQIIMPSCELSRQDEGDTAANKWALQEVVYLMRYKVDLTSAIDTEVDCVVLIFRKAGARVAVRVSKETFIAKFKAHIQAIETGTTVLFATIPDSQMQDSVAPSAMATTALPSEFPRIAVKFDKVVFGARANTAIHPFVHHIACTTANTGTMYFGMANRHYLDIPKITSYQYGNKPLWTTSTFASAKRTLVVGPTLESDGFVGHTSLKAGDEVELTQTLTGVPANDATSCFVSQTPSIKFCPSAGTLEYGSTTYTLAEVLYVPDVIGGVAADNAAVVKWAYVLHFRSATTPQTHFAIRLGPENVDMLINVVKMPVPQTVPTSTAIHASSKVALLPPWPNAHSQGTSNAAAVRALPSRPADAPQVSSPSLMPLHRARMIHYPAYQYTPASQAGQLAVQVNVTVPPVVVRYEPIPTCVEYRAKTWNMWPLCAADASARSGSAACTMFQSCSPTTPGQPAAFLIDERAAVPVKVVLYESNDNESNYNARVLYGLGKTAVYVVRHAETDLSVVIATTNGTDRLIATMDTNRRYPPTYRIAAAGPPCASLVACMKGTELECGSSLFVNCALTEDRSGIVATLEYDSKQVQLRALDADVLFGIDERGAFALHKSTGSVLYTRGVKWPEWPSVSAQASGAVVLKAALEPATTRWRVAAKTETPVSSKGSADQVLPLWITIGVLGGIVFLILILSMLRKRRISGDH